MNTYPRWSLDTIYPGFSSDAFIDNMNLLQKTCEAVVILAEDAAELSEHPEEFTGWLKDVTGHLNMMNDLYENLEAYAYSRFSVNTQLSEAIDGLNRIHTLALGVKAARVAITNALAMHEVQVQRLCAADRQFESYTFVLQEMIDDRQHLMSPELEALAADLQRSGGSAWGRLQESLSSTASILWHRDSGEYKSVIELRSLAFHHDRAVRKRAWRKELAVWKSLEIPLAAALNGVKGFTLSLDERRSYSSPLDHALKQSRITKKTLDALIGVMEGAAPILRTYLKKKAQLLGVEQLAFYDLFAPVGETGSRWTFDEARAFIIRQFTEFHTPMGEFAERAFDLQWIDAQPDEGKVGGAYCIHFPLVKESRVLCNFDGSFSSVSTVAHELGHAYHGYVMKDLPALRRAYPMTLAETASIFAETIIFQGALSDAPAGARLSMIESYLKDATQTLVDILSRFYFEQELFAQRAERELTAEQLCELMKEAQLRTYGDGLDPEQLHTYMWAVKGHYYDPELAFYNYPYAFGQLFGMGLYSTYRRDGDAFCENYVQLLTDTGSASAEEVASAAGFSIETSEFWQGGVDLLTEYVEEFCILADAHMK